MSSTDAKTWPSAWARSVLPLSVLSVIAEQQPVHGYAIMTAVRSGLGSATTGGVVYPLLRALETDGFLHSHWDAGSGGPGRKSYTLTDRGEVELQSLRAGWQVFKERVTTIGHTSDQKRGEHEE